MQWVTARWVTRMTVRFGVPLAILGVCVVFLGRQVPSDVVENLPQQLAGISALQWGLAALLTAGSFFAVAQYDVQAHRTLGTGVSDTHARISGAVGIAIGQTVGFGLFTGALARWRMVPDLSVGKALKLSALVSLTFVVAWGCATGFVAALLPAPPWTTTLSVVAFVLLPACGFVLFWWPTVRIGRHRLPLPSLRVAGAILFWASLDMILAAAALWVLLPAGTLPFGTLLPLFMVALGCGLMSNTPGGVGPFELVLVSALAKDADASLLAGIMAFRIVYYAAPACIAVLVMLRPLRARTAVLRTGPGWVALPRSEAQALTQNRGWITPDYGAPMWPTAQTVTLFTDPVRPADHDTLTHVRAVARSHGRCPMIYKSGARLAHAARRAGWAVLHLADDAIIETRDYTVAGPARARLRRKMRAAEKSGIRIQCQAMLDPDAARALDLAWQVQNGGARGGSMGRYTPAYVQNQWVVSAFRGSDLVAFATFHMGETDWCLDLMRNGDDAPDGTMHALVHQAIQDAQAAGAARVSLASIIACPDTASAAWRWASQKAVQFAGGTGLRQFKSAFAPRWVPRYAAAPSWPALVLGLADIARTIRAPDPLLTEDAKFAHQEDENYELASRKAA
ncbi:phosphatidylglycerol lysyltransferase domain-containing protein [uncultured Tateyamaria sp.]|uniref:phosphatidylglycerol lysyltransferase domain-containing protein n=1 Tax=uncultured Tateyamaria sp. TaxID=455651 RepID=UPI002609BD1E|nr:phosphatidylglycerol lysyltransferase domain-containing protein [uncultured Tateyamaria sp.]